MSEKQRILIVDVDPDLSPEITGWLSQENYETLAVSNLSESIDPIELFRPDLIVFDPIIRGSDPYHRLQSYWNTYRVPTLVISDKGDVMSKVISLEMGADDYLVKPFDKREFLARVHALLRRYIFTMKTLQSGLRAIHYPSLSINLNEYTVRCNDRLIPMPPREIELLYYLASSPNQVISRDQILHDVWGADYSGDTRTIDVHVKRIRRRLPESDIWALVTVWGVGYRFSLTL